MGKVRETGPVASVTLRRVTVPPLERLKGELRVLGAADPETRDGVARIIAAVRSEGDAAVERFQREFDRVTLSPGEWEVPRAACEAALGRLGPGVREALARAAQRIREYHERQREQGFSWATADGSTLAERVDPLDRVGVYVPGGRAAYPSSVLMTVIPARVAGVREIVAVTPPSGATDAVLAACAVARVDRLFRVGGAQAVAALAWGTTTIPRVDKIVGPGNRWVAEAKRQLVGLVGIDMIAGPTEVLVIADQAADPAQVAADLIAQAEHDADATAWLVSCSEPLVDRVEEELGARLARAPRGEIARRSLEQRGLAVIVPDLKTAIEVANLRAPEHVELLVREARSWVESLRHAGAVFVGGWTPEPVGDYLAGPSHVLPTGGTARFASPLGVSDFVKRMSVIEYSPARLELDARDIMALAEAEGLPGHAEAVRVRLERLEGPGA